MDPNNKKDQKNNQNRNRNMRGVVTLIIWALVLTVVFNYINAYSNNLTKRASSHEIPYSQLIDLIQEDQVAELKIENGVLYATPVDGYVYTEEATDKNKEPKSYTQSEKTPLILYTTALNDASLLPLLEEHNVKYTSPVQTQMSPILEFMIAYVLPTILLLGAFLLVMRLLAKNGGIGGIGRIEEEHDKYRAKGPGRISPFFVPMMIGNMAAGQVAIRTGFRGDNFCTTTACASATHAIGEAFRKIKDGYLDVCLCGGSESTITEFTLGGFRTMKALTTESDPAKASTPFDLNRGGFVLGEGSAVLVLEEYEHAKARGAKIYCELAGYGATCDAYHMTAPADECGASSKAMIEAYTEAGLKPEDITYINAHGTSTHLNDMLETKAVKIALGEEQARKVKINSTKSMTGHMLGGTGAVEAAVCALSIRDGFIHQTIGYTTPDPECDLDYCVDGPVEMPVNAALSNSLGFGGHNATLCFKKCTD